MLHLVQVARREMAVCRNQGEGGTSGDLPLGEATEPALNHGSSAAARVGEDIAPQEVTGALDVVRIDGVLDCPTAVVVLGEPRARTPMQLALELRLQAAQLPTQRLGE